MRGRGLDFSFSGHEDGGVDAPRSRAACPTGQALADLCASFQAAVVEQLVRKTHGARSSSTRLRQLQVAGGVAANRGLRAALEAELARARRRSCYVPAARALHRQRGDDRRRRLPPPACAASAPTSTLNATASLPLDRPRPTSVRADGCPTRARCSRKYGLRAKKSWGQNFLVDERAYREIVDACELRADGRLGGRDRRRASARSPRGWPSAAGARHRRRARSRHGRRSCASELGARRAHRDRRGQRAHLRLRARWRARAGRPPVVVGNLPYQIASPILFRLLDARARDRAHRRHAAEGDGRPHRRAAGRRRTYGALSVMVRMYGEPQARVPRARGRASCRRRGWTRRCCASSRYAGGRAPVPVDDARGSREVVHAAFNQRRKTLRNALRRSFEAEAARRGAGGDARSTGSAAARRSSSQSSRALPTALLRTRRRR